MYASTPGIGARLGTQCTQVIRPVLTRCNDSKVFVFLSVSFLSSVSLLRSLSSRTFSLSLCLLLPLWSTHTLSFALSFSLTHTYTNAHTRTHTHTNTQVIQQLMENGASVNVFDRSGITPLYYAGLCAYIYVSAYVRICLNVYVACVCLCV